MELKDIKKMFEEELFDYCLPFWMKNSPDEKYGGISHCLDRKGQKFSEDKGVWMQGRAGWSFSYLYNNFDKNPEYLKIAKSCIDFAREKCIDKDGRMFLTVTGEGGALAKRGLWFSETFYIMANAEYYAASGDISYLDEARKYYDLVLGIYKDPASDPRSAVSSDTPSVRVTKTFAQPMILLNVTSVMINADKEREAYYNDISKSLVEDIKCFHSEEYGATLEEISVDNRIILESAPCRVVNPGHDMECSWFLLDEAIRRGDEELASFAERMFLEAYEWGYDREHGGILYNVDILGGPVEAYEHDMKIWWVHNEVIIAALMMYLHTGKERYKAILDEMIEYSFSHFSDREFGEWYASLDRNGVPNEPTLKGFIYKGPFHTVRMLAKCIKLIEGSEK